MEVKECEKRLLKMVNKAIESVESHDIYFSEERFGFEISRELRSLRRAVSEEERSIQ